MRRTWFRRAADDDAGSMPMALLVSLVAISLTAILVPTVVNQVVSTRTVTNRTVALDAAQAGLDAAIAQLRAASLTTTTVVGTEKVTKLAGSVEALPPCLMQGVQDLAGLRYKVAITYYGLPDNAVDDTPVALPCPPLDVPVTARLTATGTSNPAGEFAAGSSGTRTLQATYTFKTNNENITGGAIMLAAASNKEGLCLDGGPDASPAAGTAVTLQACKEGGSSDQRFSYTADLNIKLVGSATGLAPDGMCLDDPLPHRSGDAVTFQPCLGRSARQQWSLDDNSNFRSTPDGVRTESLCLNVQSAGDPGPLVIGGCGGTTNKQVFRMQTGVGAGMASVVTDQLVNYRQFSRCLDVTDLNVGKSYMIVWFCKQAPNGAVTWNQKWALPAESTELATAVQGQIRTAGSDGKGYCLQTPTSLAGYPTLKQCGALTAVTAIPALQRWTVYGKTGDYATSYRIVDNNGYCLTPTDLSVKPPDTHTDGTAKVKVAPCTSSELQKWNAPANFNKPMVVTNLQEK